MNLSTEIKEKYYCIYLDGELDASSALEFDNALKAAVEQGRENIIIDGAKLSYISSAGLGVIMSYLSYFQENTINFVICNLKDNVWETFKILGLEKLVTIVSTHNEALKKINEV